MKKMKIAALCLSVAIALTTITVPVLASDNANRATLEVKEQMAVCLDKSDKSKDIKFNPGNFSFNFTDSEDYAESMAWAIKAIEKLGAKGILKGYSDKSFKPQNKVTNLEALTMILNITKKDQAAVSTKINPALAKYQAQWKLKWGLTEVLSVAVDKGILLPEEIKGFNPNQFIKRHEFAKYLVRALDKTQFAKDNINAKLPFKDANAIPKASIGYVYVVYNEKIMIGNDKGQFKPNEPLTRAEIATLIDKYLDKNDNGKNDNDKNETKVKFISYDKENNKLYIDYNGTLKYYTTVENVPVYKNGKIVHAKEVVTGDILDLIFSKTNPQLVLFIQVVGHEDGNENYRTNITLLSVDDENLPASIKEDAEILKHKTERSYKVYKYDNNIYLAAFMGLKTTGGYTINIDNAYRYSLNNGKYIVEAVVKETQPASGSDTTQVLTFPYTIVRFGSFDNIEKINFVDTDGKLLAQREVSILDKVTTVKGTFVAINADKIYLKVSDSTDVTVKDIGKDVKVYVNNKEAKLSDLKIYMKIKLTLVNDIVTEISADYEVKEVKGLIQALDTTNKLITVKQDGKSEIYPIEENAAVTLNGIGSRLSDLLTGMKVTVELINGKVTRIVASTNTERYLGKVVNINIDNGIVKLITININNVEKTFIIPDGTKFTLKADSTPLAIGDDIEIIYINEKLTEVIEK